MAINGPYPVDSAALFPCGLYALGNVSAVTVYQSEPPVQERDKVSGLPLWQVDVMDADPDAWKELRTFRVKIAAEVQPVLPDPIPGTSIRPVVLEGLTISAWLEKDKETKKPHREDRLRGAGDRRLGAEADRAGKGGLRWPTVRGWFGVGRRTVFRPRGVSVRYDCQAERRAGAGGDRELADRAPGEVRDVARTCGIFSPVEAGDPR